MSDKEILKRRIKESLVDFLPAYQRPFAKEQCYEELIDKLTAFWCSKNDLELKQLFELAKENFDHCCDIEIRRLKE